MVNPDVELDPRAAMLLERIHPPDQPSVDPDDAGVDAVRLAYATLCRFGGPGPDVASTEDVAVTPDVPGRWYRTESPRAVGIWFHGGGQAIGSLETHDPVSRAFAVQCRLDVLSPDYRLAPEHPFPASIEDALATVRLAREEADDRGLPLVVGGDSAGGNLTIAACVEAGEHGLRIDAALPAYPGTMAGADNDSMRAFGERHLLTARNIEWFWHQWLGKDGAADPPPRSQPGVAGDLSVLPPTLVLTLSHDPLRDEGEEFVDRARAAGATVEHLRIDGHIHAVLNLAAIFPDACDQWWSAASDYLDRVLSS